MKLLLTQVEALAELPGVTEWILRGWIAAGVIRRERLPTSKHGRGSYRIPCGEVVRVRGLLERGEPVMPEPERRSAYRTPERPKRADSAELLERIAARERELLGR